MHMYIQYSRFSNTLMRILFESHWQGSSEHSAHQRKLLRWLILLARLSQCNHHSSHWTNSVHKDYNIQSDINLSFKCVSQIYLSNSSMLTPPNHALVVFKLVKNPGSGLNMIRCPSSRKELNLLEYKISRTVCLKKQNKQTNKQTNKQKLTANECITDKQYYKGNFMCSKTCRDQ